MADDIFSRSSACYSPKIYYVHTQFIQCLVELNRYTELLRDAKKKPLYTVYSEMYIIILKKRHCQSLENAL